MSYLYHIKRRPYQLQWFNIQYFQCSNNNTLLNKKSDSTSDIFVGFNISHIFFIRWHIII
jgi:hypothetical protein